MEIWDLFDVHLDFVKIVDLAEKGVQKNHFYTYVSSSYLDGVVNGITFFKAFLIERYSEFNQETEKEIKEYGQQDHSKFGTFGNDTFLLGETENSYWLFWYDLDVSNCSIGRFEKKRVENKEHFIKLWSEWIKSWEEDSEGRKPNENTEVITGNYKEIPLPKGWISY